MTINGREHIPKTGPFVLAPVHRSYVDTPIAGCVTTRRMRFMGKDTMWNNRTVRLAALGARRLPCHARHGRSRGAGALHRRARGGRAARAVSRGRAQVGPGRAAAVRRCRVRRDQGRRADRAGRHRWLREGDAEEGQVRVPAQGARRDRPADPAAGRTARRPSAAARLQGADHSTCTPSCSACSTWRCEHVPWDYAAETE